MNNLNFKRKNNGKLPLPIIYDYQIFQAQRFGGISRYFCEIIRRLDCDYKITIRYCINYYLTSWHLCDHIPLPRFIYKKFSRFFKKRNFCYTKSILKCNKNFLFHPTYYNSYFLKYIGTNPYVVTVHDMIHEKFPHYFSDTQDIIQQKKRVITKAKRIIAISENTKNDIIEILGIDPNKIDVIYHGTSMKPSSGNYKLDLPDKYLLFVGDRTPYKNFQRFMEVFAELHKNDKELYVIYTGSRLHNQEIAQLPSEALNYAIHIKASDEELSELYSRALLFVYPSLYEGFGIPILEAYACNCPIAISNTSCFPEVAGNAAVYFDPYSNESMFKSIREIIYNENKRQLLIQLGNARLKRYSWDIAAEKTYETYKKAIESI